MAPHDARSRYRISGPTVTSLNPPSSRMSWSLRASRNLYGCGRGPRYDSDLSRRPGRSKGARSRNVTAKRRPLARKVQNKQACSDLTHINPHVRWHRAADGLELSSLLTLTCTRQDIQKLADRERSRCRRVGHEWPELPTHQGQRVSSVSIQSELRPATNYPGPARWCAHRTRSPCPRV